MDIRKNVITKTSSALFLDDYDELIHYSINQLILLNPIIKKEFFDILKKQKSSGIQFSCVKPLPGKGMLFLFFYVKKR